MWNKEAEETIRKGDLKQLKKIIGESKSLVRYIETGFNGERLIHYAAGKGQIEIIEFLLECGENVDALDNYYRSPLFHAVMDLINPKVVDVLKFLLSKGANPHRVDRRGDTLLHVATGIGNQYVIPLLLDLGLDVNALNKHKQTPLHKSAGKWNIEINTLILQGGADINRVDGDNKTLLQHAKEHYSYIQKGGSDYHLGRTQKDQMFNLQNIINLLITYGAT